MKYSMNKLVESLMMSMDNISTAQLLVKSVLSNIMRSVANERNNFKEDPLGWYTKQLTLFNVANVMLNKKFKTTFLRELGLPNDQPDSVLLECIFLSAIKEFHNLTMLTPLPANMRDDIMYLIDSYLHDEENIVISLDDEFILPPKFKTMSLEKQKIGLIGVLKEVDVIVEDKRRILTDDEFITFGMTIQKRRIEIQKLLSDINKSLKEKEDGK